MGNMQNSTKIPIFKKNFFSYHGSHVINKNVSFFKKLITPKLNSQFLEKNHDNADYK